VGALGFGYLTDRLGRKKLFLASLGLYLAATICTGLSWSAASFWAFRFLTGLGIGGEYSAINSAIDELIPARFRGRVDIMVNGTYWGGALLGTLSTFILLNQLDPSLGWRIGFLVGPVLGLLILIVRRHLPESARWQVMHGREREAEETIAYIEHEVAASGRELPEVDESKAIEVKASEDHGYLALLKVLFQQYPRRAVLGAAMMITQSFLYNAIFFTYTLVLGTFYGVPSESTPLYLIAFCVGNLAGPLTLGHLFDTLGRKVMISSTYIGSGVLLAISAFLFNAGLLTAITQTIAWCVIFFFVHRM
jgi:MFS family permease